MCAISGAVREVFTRKEKSAVQRQQRKANKAKLAARKEERRQLLDNLRSLIPDVQSTSGQQEEKEEPSDADVVLATARYIVQLEEQIRRLPNASFLVMQLLKMKTGAGMDFTPQLCMPATF